MSVFNLSHWQIGVLSARRTRVIRTEDHDLLTDGIRSTAFFAGSCSHTDNEAKSWWVVDLGEEYRIDTVRITNRAEGSGTLKQV